MKGDLSILPTGWALRDGAGMRRWWGVSNHMQGRNEWVRLYGVKLRNGVYVDGTCLNDYAVDPNEMSVVIARPLEDGVNEEANVLAPEDIPF